MSIHLQHQEDIFHLGPEQNNKEHNHTIIQEETASQDKRPSGKWIIHEIDYLIIKDISYSIL